MAVGHLAANRLFKPMVKNHLDQPERYIMTRHCNRSKPKPVGARRQSSESGNPREPNGENTWDVPVFGKMKVSDVFKNAGLAVSLFLGGMNTGTNIWMIRRQSASEGKKSEKEDMERREENTTLLSKDWREIADFREAVLHRHDGVLNAVFPFLHTWIVTNVQSRHGSATTTNKPTVVNTKPAPKSFVEVIRFFGQWEYFHKHKTIDSARLKDSLGSEPDKFRDILTEIRDEEAKGWHKADSDNLKAVIDFLDKISKMEKEG